MKKEKWIEIAMTVILLFAAILLSEKAAVKVMKIQEERAVEESVSEDAGHEAEMCLD